MTIQNISSSTSYANSYGITKSVGVIQQDTLAALPTNTQSSNYLLTPEQKNTLQDNFNAKIAEQANNIKSNFQTAKDIDLTRAYYEQQQRLVDIYMQAGTENSSSSKENISATKALTDTYASLYQLHQTIKEGAAQLPGYSDINQLPATATEMTPAATLPLAHRQTDTYNSLMMPTTNSYLNLHA